MSLEVDVNFVFRVRKMVKERLEQDTGHWADTDITEAIVAQYVHAVCTTRLENQLVSLENLRKEA